MANVILGIRLSLYDFQRVKIEDVDLHLKVEKFKDEVSIKANLPKESFELVYCGNILDDYATLHSCGVKSGVMVHVLKKKAKEIPKVAQPMSETDIQSLLRTFMSLSVNPAYRSNLQKLSRQDILDNIILITPSLSQDPVAISMIQDPELLLRMGDLETVRRIVELHPALADAASHIVAAVHEMSVSALGASPSTQPSTSTGYSYSLDALSDEEDSSESSESQAVGTRHAITAAQLASALASANSASPGPSQESSNITPEMFSQAMQRAIASVVGQPLSGEASGSDGSQSLAQQMQQMRELGLTDDAINLQALQISQGNVHAAIELVFSGTISPPP